MKNLKVSVKLLICFSILIILTIFIGGFGYYGMNSIFSDTEDILRNNLIPMQKLSEIQDNYREQNIVMRDVIYTSASSNAFREALKKITENEENVSKLIYEYRNTLKEDGEEKEKLDRFENFYYNEFDKLKKEVIKAGAINDFERAASLLELGNQTIVQMNILLNNSMDYYVGEAERINQENAEHNNFLYFLMFAILFGSVVIMIVFTIYMSRVITNPLRKMVEAAQAISAGNVHLEVDYESRDEIGSLSSAFRKMTNNLRTTIDVLDSLAEGDLTVNVFPKSENDELGIALRKVVENLRSIILEISGSAQSVYDAAVDINNENIYLEKGANNQAAAVEELSSAVFEISLNTKENAKLSGKAAEISSNVKANAESSAGLMKNMLDAVNDITKASSNIGKIINLIDSISTQTNILALNASVEAANAGQHGKGFAVVAQEVRSLAEKSTKAARDTNDLIVNSLEKTELGSKIATDTSKSLNAIVTEIKETAALIKDIALSSDEQSSAIEQVNIGIEQVAKIVNLNTVSVKKCSDATEQLAKQAEMMEALVSKFKINDDKINTEQTQQKHAPENKKVVPNIILDESEAKEEYNPANPDNTEAAKLNDSDFGKY